MEELRVYVLHISATALICAVVLRLVCGGGAVKKIMQLLCGIVLAYSIIKPVKQLNYVNIDIFDAGVRQSADQAVRLGQDTASAAWAESISQGTEAYILEKANAMKTDLAVEVELSSDDIPVPVAVSLKGDVAPYVKSVLSDTIARDLNIPKEKQKWILQ